MLALILVVQQLEGLLQEVIVLSNPADKGGLVVVPVPLGALAADRKF